jgi:hypothetical protein
MNPLVLDSMCGVFSILLLEFPRHVPIGNHIRLATQEKIWRQPTQVKIRHSHLVLPVGEKTVLSKCAFAASAAF